MVIETRRSRAIVFVGPTGVGRPALALGILFKTLQNGYRCQFVRAEDLFDDLFCWLRRFRNYRFRASSTSQDSTGPRLLGVDMSGVNLAQMRVLLARSVDGSNPTAVGRSRRPDD